MLLWFVFALLTALVIAGVSLPLVRDDTDGIASAEADLEVYRDQMTEIDTDLERGLIGKDEAESARTELARRLLRRADQQKVENEEAPKGGGSSSRPALVAKLAAVALPLAALTTYLAVGSPHLPGQPLAPRLAVPANKATVEQLVAKVERRLRTHPDDGMGWDVVAPVYLRQRQFEKAADAFSRAAKLLGETPARLIGFLRARISAANGEIDDLSRKASRRLLQLDPQNISARAWLAEAQLQDGDPAAALAAFRKLLEHAETGTQWHSALTQRIAAIEKLNPNAAQEAPTAAPSPGDDQPEASATGPQATPNGLSIPDMVERLATRLREDGNDLPGWERLIRSYVVLGNKQKAENALTDARKAFDGDEASLQRINEFASKLGVGS